MATKTEPPLGATRPVSPSGGMGASAERWPEDGLEPVTACPVCGEAGQEPLHSGLRDRVFGCAPGKWNLCRCTVCGSGYLNPRPTAATIGLAYTTYFTHDSARSVELPPRSAWRRHRTAQRNAYLNTRYGYQLTPAAARVPRWLSTDRRQRWDKYVAFLRYPGKGARLLDVGCGNGRFLMQMRAAGWEVYGVEPDPKSAAQAVAAGLDVRTGLLPDASLPGAHFDAVTLSHVIEHLHKPIETLHECWRILKPGGTISIATPNLGGQGHHVFGPDWFALDPPRHLVLFTPDSLRQALQMAGFEPEAALRPRVAAKDIFRRSMHVRNGSDPMSERPALPFATRLKAAWLAQAAHRATRARAEAGEELVLLARRPLSS